MNMIGLYYPGGAFGHFLLHLILLGKKHGCVYKDSVPFAEVYAKQWDITGKWKNTEFEVDNNRINEVTELIPVEMISVFENQNYKDIVAHIKNANFPTYSTHLDEDLHEMMIRHKILNPSPASLDVNAEWDSFYNRVKHRDWPNIPFVECNQLHDSVKNRIIGSWLFPKSSIINGASNDLQYLFAKRTEQQHFEQCYLDEVEKRLSLANRMKIAKEIYNAVDINIDLKDIIATQGQSVCEHFNIPHTNEHIALVKKWVQLHPLHIKEILLSYQ
jgi:hypothetical protein